MAGSGTGRQARVGAGAEALLGAAVVIVDVVVPTLVLLPLAAVSWAVRRGRHPLPLGFARPASWRGLLGVVAATVIALTLAEIALVMPVLEHLTGTRQDLGDFASVHGDVGLFLTLLALTWTIAAFGEEIAYRGHLLTRCEAAVGGRAAPLVAVAVTSVLFGLAHREQGVIGVVLTTLDAVVFCWLRRRTGTLWAPVLAHGLSNTLGITWFFAVGPVHGLW